MFKYVSYWNPSIELDSRGNGSFEFEVPDNLTGWRVLVLAVTPTDRLGLGEGSFKVNLPTEVRPVMPNQVTEGDRFDAAFSVMNRTDAARDIRVAIAAEGGVAAPVDACADRAPRAVCAHDGASARRSGARGASTATCRPAESSSR